MEKQVVTSLLTEHIGFIEWAAASRTHPHEVICGDAYSVRTTRHGALLCVIDGLGHGPEAAEASQAALSVISDHDDDDTGAILSHCHEALKPTRGAVLSLAKLDTRHNNLSWIGIGNVEGILLRPGGSHEWLPLRGGIVGCRLPTIRVSETPVVPGDSLIMFSDGIAGQFLDLLSTEQSPAEMAERIIGRGTKGYDDAMVLVVKYHGTVYEA
jgi:serine phosphatase RsbU (regulator of sigma subunit)